jgi:ABC-type branched-subunit amino acid transport system permease subunit
MGRLSVGFAVGGFFVTLLIPLCRRLNDGEWMLLLIFFLASQLTAIIIGFFNWHQRTSKIAILLAFSLLLLVAFNYLGFLYSGFKARIRMEKELEKERNSMLYELH